MNHAAPVTTQQQVFRKLLRHRSATHRCIYYTVLHFRLRFCAPLIATHDPRHADIVERLKGWSDHALPRYRWRWS